MKFNIAEIKKAILLHRGGFENATDAQLLTIWNSLDAEVQDQYMKNLKGEKGNAPGTRP